MMNLSETQESAKQILLEALAFYKIHLAGNEGALISLQDNYTVEVEPNGLYKLKSDGQVIAPFDDLNELCRFILT